MAIPVDRMIRNLDNCTEAELTKLRRAINARLGEIDNQITADDLEVLQGGVSGSINVLRQQRNRYKAQLEFYEEYFPKEWIAYVNGKNASQGQTRVGIAVMLHEGEEEETRLLFMEGLSPSPLEETQNNVTTTLYNAIGMVPEAADMGNQHLDGLVTNDWKRIFLELTPFRYAESLKARFGEKQAALFGHYYSQIQPNYISESRSATQTRFNMIISRTFEKRESRASKTKFIIEKLDE